MMKSLTLTAWLAALMLTLPTLAAEAPQKAIGKDTALVVWIDVEQIDADMIQQLGEMMAGLADNPLLKEQGAGLPIGQVIEMVDGLTTFRNGFVQAGGEGLLMTMEMPGEDSWSPPMSLLAKSSDKVDAKSMAALIRTMSEDEMDAELLPIGEGWHDVALTAKVDGEPVTLPLPEPDEKVFKSFDKQLSATKDPVFSVAFRMQDDMRELMKDAAAPGGQQNPQLAMVMGMLQPLNSLDTLGMAVSLVDEDAYEIDVQMVFLDAQQANQFATLYNSIVMFAPAMLAQQLQGIEDAPDPKTLNDFFMKLQMQIDGDTLKLKLDAEFFELLEKLAPLFQGEDPQPQGGGGGQL